MKKNKSTRTRSRDDRKNSPFEDRKKFCPFSQKNSPIIDYKDVKLLSSGKSVENFDLTKFLISLKHKKINLKSSNILDI